MRQQSIATHMQGGPGMAYRLGLDMGTNSIGWAAVKLDSRNRPCGVLDMGVRIFSDGRNPKDKTSLAVQRRIPRGARRRRDRYLKRRTELLDILIACGLMPPDEISRKEIAKQDPWSLRAAALDRPLPPFELGRALFHLNQRRGFKSNRKTSDEKEESATREDIAELRKRIVGSGARTLGDYLNTLHAAGRSVRGRPGEGLYPDRALYKQEFDAIRAAQEPHQTLRQDQWDSMEETIFFQRPLKPVRPGWCLLEEGEERAPRAFPLTQEFRMVQEVNNLKFRVGIEPEQFLTIEERERAMQRLRSGRDIGLTKKPTRDLGLPSDAIFNLARGGRKKIAGDEIAKILKKDNFFGDGWLESPLEERNEIVRVLLETEDPETVQSIATSDWGLTKTRAAAVANVSLPPGYGNLSEKALRNIVPIMDEEGVVYSRAIELCERYDHHSDFRSSGNLPELPYYGQVMQRDVTGANPQQTDTDEVTRFGRIGNPTVHIGLNQLRRVVNRLIEVHGKPQDIVVELARELKMSREDIRRLERERTEGARKNEEYREQIESLEQDVTASVLKKLRLWEEQGPPQARVCPYTGRTLSFEMVMSAQTEIDHILPFSRTLDNGRSNQVVCMATANRFKGNQTPYEAFGHSPTGYNYDEILAQTTAFPANKSWRFHENAMERYEDVERDFLDRQLNETQYLSRTARSYLANLYDEKNEGAVRVRAIPGRMTALLRRSWGLNGTLSEAANGEQGRKQRDDHRHHAVDALVVALTSQGLLQAFASATAGSEDTVGRLLKLVPRPWKGFSREEIQTYLNRITVSHKLDHGTPGNIKSTSGQLHKDTAYGLIGSVPIDDLGNWNVVIRKGLASFKRETDFDAVRDPALREALLELWRKNELALGNSQSFAERATVEGVFVNGTQQKVRRVRVTDTKRVIPILDPSGHPYKGYLPGGNEYAEIWRMPNGKWQITVVSTFGANQPNFDHMSRRPHPAAKRLARLQIGDTCALGLGDDQRILRVRMITDNATRGTIVLDEHHEANTPSRSRDPHDPFKEKKYSARQLKRQGFRKVGVDEIGRLTDPGLIS